MPNLIGIDGHPLPLLHIQSSSAGLKAVQSTMPGCRKCSAGVCTSCSSYSCNTQHRFWAYFGIGSSRKVDRLYAWYASSSPQRSLACRQAQWCGCQCGAGQLCASVNEGMLRGPASVSGRQGAQQSGCHLADMRSDGCMMRCLGALSSVLTGTVHTYRCRRACFSCRGTPLTNSSRPMRNSGEMMQIQ